MKTKNYMYADIPLSFTFTVYQHAHVIVSFSIDFVGNVIAGHGGVAELILSANKTGALCRIVGYINIGNKLNSICSVVHIYKHTRTKSYLL